nr:hypothetical protein BgiMline_020927 [Biomphalaria glabrata]
MEQRERVCQCQTQLVQREWNREKECVSVRRSWCRENGTERKSVSVSDAAGAEKMEQRERVCQCQTQLVQTLKSTTRDEEK